MPNRKEIVAQQHLKKLNTLAREGRYQELAELIVKSNTDLGSASPEEKDDCVTRLEATAEFYKQLAELTPDQQVDPEKKKIVAALMKELAEIRTRGLIETGLAFREWKEKIQNGEIPEVNILKDEDPKLSEDVAHDVALHKTEGGRKLMGAFNVISTLIASLQGKPAWQEVYKSREISQYGNFIKDPLKSEFAKPIYKEYPVTDQDITEFFGRYGENPQSQSELKGFFFQPDYHLDNGKVTFSRIPDTVREVTEPQTPEQLDANRKKHEDRKADLELYKQLCDELAFEAESACSSIEERGGSRYEESDRYKDFMDSLRNISKIGKEFTIKAGIRTIVTADHFKDKIEGAIKDTITKGNAYLEELSTLGSGSTTLEDYRNAVYDTINITLGERFPRIKELGKKIGSQRVEAAIPEEEKCIERIDKAAEQKGFTPKMMKNARLNTLLGEQSKQLESLVDQAVQANQVHRQHDDYNEAISAIRQLAASSKAYNELRSQAGLMESQRDLVEKIREQAMQAQEKVSRYVERKERQLKKKGKLDEKGKNRLEIMKNVFEQTCEIWNNMDETMGALDSMKLDQEAKELEQSMYARMVTNRDKLLEQAMMSGDSNRIVAGNAAAQGISAIVETLQTGEAVKPENQPELRDAAVKYALYLADAYPKQGEVTNESYQKMITETAFDKRFADAFSNITREQLQTLAADGNNQFLTDIYLKFTEVKAQREAEAALEEQQKQQAVPDALTQFAQKQVNALDEVIRNANEPNAERYADEPVSATVQAAQTAKRGMGLLLELAANPAPMEEEDVQIVREAYAALAIQSSGNMNSNNKISYEDYLKQVRILANDKNFIKAVGNVEKNDIAAFIQDEKAPAKLMDRFLSTKKNALDNENLIVHSNDNKLEKKTELQHKLGT